MVRMTPFRDRLAERLSGGMKQKLALVCTLVHTPELLVLDEPTTGVDPVSRRDFWKLLARLQREGLTILLTTPYLDEAERCTRVALIDQRPAPHRGRPRRAAGGREGRDGRGRGRAAARARSSPARAPGRRRGRGLRRAAPREPAGRAARARGGGRRVPWPRGCAGRGSRCARPGPTTPSLEDVFIGRIRAREAAAAVEVNP